MSVIFTCTFLTICVASFSTNVSSGFGLSVIMYYNIKNTIRELIQRNICAVLSCGLLTVTWVLEKASKTDACYLLHEVSCMAYTLTLTMYLIYSSKMSANFHRIFFFTRTRNVSETGSASILSWGVRHLLRWVPQKELTSFTGDRWLRLGTKLSVLNYTPHHEDIFLTSTPDGWKWAANTPWPLYLG
jgi:hypothetical protein